MDEQENQGQRAIGTVKAGEGEHYSRNGGANQSWLAGDCASSVVIREAAQPRS